MTFFALDCGDVDLDNAITPTDASAILQEYAPVDAEDATTLLTHYMYEFAGII